MAAEPIVADRRHAEVICHGETPSRGVAEIQGRTVTPPGVGFAEATVAMPLRALMTKVLLSPSFDHGPCGTSLKSTNFQSVTSVSSIPR